MKVETASKPAPPLRSARLATATLFFANGCGLGSWLPHIPDVEIRHGLSDGVLGLALGHRRRHGRGAAGALTARYRSRPISRAAAVLFCTVLPLLAPNFPLCSRRCGCSGSASALSMSL